MIEKDDATTMVLPSALDAALGRFSAALDRLQAAADSRAIHSGGGAAAATPDDRARLAAELDAALARTARLVSAHAEALGRLDRAEATIRTVAGGLAAPMIPPDEGEA